MNVDIEDDQLKFHYFESNQSESTQLLWRQDTKIFSFFFSWMLIGQFEFQERQPYARLVPTWAYHIEQISSRLSYIYIYKEIGTIHVSSWVDEWNLSHMVQGSTYLSLPACRWR